MSQFLWQAAVNLFVIINPFAVAAVFVSLTSLVNPTSRRRIALKSASIAALILLSFAFAGDKLLDMMNISEPAFRIAGGFLLLLAAVNMVVARNSNTPPTSNREKDESPKALHDVSVFPLAIPLMAGPGSLTSIVILMRHAEVLGSWSSLGVIFILISILLLTYLFMLLGTKLMKILGMTGIDVMTRVCGILLAALAVENIINGLVIIVKTVIASC